MIRFAKGAGIPQPHFHASNQFMICLSGKYEYTATGVVLTAGSVLLQSEGQRPRPGGRPRGHCRDRGLRRPALSREAVLVHRRAGRPLMPKLEVRRDDGLRGPLVRRAVDRSRDSGDDPRQFGILAGLDPCVPHLAGTIASSARTCPGSARRRSPPNGWTAAELAADIGRFLDALNIERCHLIGAKYGGSACMRLAIDQPHRLARSACSARRCGAAAAATPI